MFLDDNIPESQARYNRRCEKCFSERKDKLTNCGIRNKPKDNRMWEKMDLDNRAKKFNKEIKEGFRTIK